MSDPDEWDWVPEKEPRSPAAAAAGLLGCLVLSVSLWVLIILAVRLALAEL